MIAEIIFAEVPVGCAFMDAESSAYLFKIEPESSGEAAMTVYGSKYFYEDDEVVLVKLND